MRNLTGIKKILALIILATFSLGLISSSVNAKSSVVRKVRNGVCISALIGLVGWAWWNDYIRFPGEEELREKERLQQTTLQREIHVSESNPLTSSFKVSGSAYGDLKINQAVFAMGATLYLRTKDEQLIAVGKKAYNTWVATIEVRDNDNHLIGTLKQDRSASLGTGISVYSILDASGNEIATSGRISTLVKNFLIKSADGTPIVSIDNELGVRDNWTIKIFNSDILDERLLILLAAFQTATGR